MNMAMISKSQRSFKISEAKVLQVAGDKLSWLCLHPCCPKEGEKWSQLEPALAESVKLLGELGASERVCAYYLDALSDAGVHDLQDSDE